MRSRQLAIVLGARLRQRGNPALRYDRDGHDTWAAPRLPPIRASRRAP